MKIAVEGCCHGELDKIYDTIKFIENKDKIKVDILLICGDFQAVRNRSDLQSMAVPPKYQLMNTFHKYYSGEAKAPLLTIIIGGNHEASSYMQELPYGGWLAPNIYYLGYAGVVKFGGLRIAGMSGIFKGHDYNRGHYEHPPYNDNTKRSVYHVRNFDVFRLKQMKSDIDIFLSHDWPRGIYNYGNVRALLRRKKFFKEEVDNGTLGNPAAEELLHALKPKHWFSAHLHCKFAAIVQHKAEGGTSPKTTKFLALDKCLPNRSFLQVLDIAHPSKEELQLELDPEWMCILKSTNHLLNLTKSAAYMPGLGSSERYDFTPTDDEVKELSSDFGGLFKIPENFTRTAETHNVQLYTPKKKKQRADPPQMHINAQTTLLCEMLGLTDPFAVFSGKQTHSTVKNQTVAPKMPTDDSDVGLDDESDEGVRSDEDTVPSFIDSTMETTFETSQEGGAAFNVTSNPDEISLDDIDDFEEEKSQSDSNMDTSTVSAEGGVGTGASGSGTETEMNISVTGGNINVISGSDSIVDVSALVSTSGAPSPISRFGPQGSSTPQPTRSKLLLGQPRNTPDRKDSGCEGQLLGKRISDEGVNNVDKSMEESTPGPSKPKKFKRRNQSIYQDTSGDTE